MAIGTIALYLSSCSTPVEKPPPGVNTPARVVWTPAPIGGGKPVPIPPPDPEAVSLKDRVKLEAEALTGADVDFDFRFTDRRPTSGITFRNYVVDDIKRDLKPVHYDHGNGVAAADVDGDGHTDLYFTTQLGRNELWRNVGDGTFEDITSTSGLTLADRISVAASFADYDNDGDPDVFVTTARMGNSLFNNDGHGVFTDVTSDAGLELTAHSSGHSSGAVFFDYDLDGALDLFVTNVGRYTIDAQGEGGYYIGLLDAFSGHLYPEREETSRLYRNAGDGTFQDVTEEVGLDDRGWSGDATPVDFNGDRYPDLYVLDMQGHDEYWVNQGGNRFVASAAEVFPETPWGSMGVKAFDHDNDGDFDLMLTDMHSDMSQEVGFERENLKSEMRWQESLLRSGGRSVFGNAFFQNRGDGTFAEVSDEIGTENYWPWGITVADFNADGFQDVFVAASMSYPYRYMPNLMLLNEGGRRFVDAVFALGVEPRSDEATYLDWFDLDCGGPDSAHSICSEHDEKITVRGTLGTRSAVALDIEGDGDLDLVTQEFGHYPQVLTSDLSERREIQSLPVRLIGAQSNRDGLGAVVTVVTESGRYTMMHDGKSGYLSQSSQPLYFGLGNATTVREVQVSWPSGAAQTVREGIELNRTLVVRELSGTSNGAGAE